jgi:NADH dehydrogenase
LLLLGLLAGEESSAAQEPLPVNGVIWTAGLHFQPPSISAEPPRDERGRLACERDLRLRGADEVFVVGDLAGIAPPEDSPLPSTAQVAFQQAPVVADNLLRSLAGAPLEPFLWKDLGEMLSLGRGEACLTGMGVTLAGPAAYQVRRLAYLTRLPGRQHQIRVAAGWLADWAP